MCPGGLVSNFSQPPRRELLYTLRGMIRGTQVNDPPADVAACVCPSVSADWTIDAPVDLDELTIAPKRFWRGKQQAFIRVIRMAKSAV